MASTAQQPAPPPAPATTAAAASAAGRAASPAPPPPTAATAPPPAPPPRPPSSAAAHRDPCKEQLQCGRPQLAASSLGVSCSNGQHYSLRWNNHQSHVLNAFEALLQSEALVDCTLVCEDTSLRAHKVVLSACSPYFQKIFVDNPCKHPIIVLKDIRGWEVQCIVDFMYKGETSVPEANLTSLIKAAESLKVRGLTSSDQQTPSRTPSLAAPPPPPPSHNGSAYMPPHAHAPRGYSPSPRSQGGYPEHPDAPAPKMPHMQQNPNNGSTASSQSSPMSLTNHQDSHNRASPGPSGAGPRRKQARPRRRSGDSIGNASLDLSKSDSPPLSSLSGASNNNSGTVATPRSPHGPRDHSAPPTGTTNSQRTKNSSPGSMTQHHTDETPENLSLNRPSSSPAINLVKTEHLMEERGRSESARPHHHHMERAHSSDPHLNSRASAGPHPHMPPNAPQHDMHHDMPHGKPSPNFLRAAAAAAAQGGPGPIPPPTSNGSGSDRPYSLHSFQEHEARAEALQALNFMAAGGGLPHHFPGHPLAGHQAAAAAAAAHAHHPGPHGPPGPHALASLAAAGAAAQAAAAAAHSQSGRPTSTPSTPSNSFPGPSSGGGRGPKGQHSAPRGGPPRSWTNDELTKALENVWNKRMTTSQASRIYGIPYNSLLMYVRGKYGKSLKLDKLKKTTPAAHDTLNTIGNSRSTPKEKILARASKALSNLVSASQQQGKTDTATVQPPQMQLPSTSAAAAAAAAAAAEPKVPVEAGRIKELLMEMHQQQTFLNSNAAAEQLKEIEKRLGAEHAKLLLQQLEQQAELAAKAGWPISPPGEEPPTASLLQLISHHHSHSSPSRMTPGSHGDGQSNQSEEMMEMRSDMEDEDEEIEVGEEEEEMMEEEEDQVSKELLSEAAKAAAAIAAQETEDGTCKDPTNLTQQTATSEIPAN